VLAALYATSAGVDESRDEHATGDFDWLGAAVIAVAVGGLAFGATRGQERGWEDPLGFAALGLGAVATIAVPWLMAVRRHPLVPPSLFRSRNFTVVNLSTFVIYGALYVTLTFQGLFLQGTLGYTPTGAGLVALPAGVLLILLSTRAGRLAARIGPRLFLTVGPLLMAAGLLWFARIPSTSDPWLVDLAHPGTLLPSRDVLVDVLPAIVTFGVGVSMLVAPLTTALMSSVPVRNAGLGSAINNAISRIGSPLASAVLFIAITATFYPALAAKVPGLDVNAPELREAVQPLTRPSPAAPPAVAAAAREASTDAFRLAMLVAALLCAAGAAVNAIGISNGSARASEGMAQPAVD
jgi:predicted MFS family arabinose efflux permease